MPDEDVAFGFDREDFRDPELDEEERFEPPEDCLPPEDELRFDEELLPEDDEDEVRFPLLDASRYG